MRSVDYSDIQGLTAFGYSKLTEATYVLAGIRDVAAARAWLASAPISTAEYKAVPLDVALQIGFTSAGLRSLGLSEAVVNGFAPEFVSGMAGEASRSRRLGDTGANQPACWLWGGPDNVPDVIFMLFAKQNVAASLGNLQSLEWQRAFEIDQCLSTSDMGGFEPFGFHDSISQPKIDWNPELQPSANTIDYSNEVALGEFLLGYVNEYGKYTDRPLIDTRDDLAGDLPAAEDAPDKKDLGRNGTYLVIRQLEQDARGFWRFLETAADGDSQMKENLGAAIVGRQRSGEPLMPVSGRVIAGVEDKPGQPRNSFTYDGDPAGTGCPFGAHIRRANPRNADLYDRPGSALARLSKELGLPAAGFHQDLIASTRFHRILRRGREYGNWLAPADAVKLAPADEEPRGLHFACLGANIARQFEFVQSAWIMSTKFNGLSEESDPLLGNRQAVGDCPYTGNFSLPEDTGLRRVIKGMPQFVTVRGGAYFFMPSLGALRFISRGGRE